MTRQGLLSDKEANLIDEHVEDPVIVKALYGQDAVFKHLDSTLQILVDAEELYRLKRESYQFVKAKAVVTNNAYGFNGKIEIECHVACSKLYKLQEVIQGGRNINVLDYLSHLIPNFKFSGMPNIGLISFQNGIQNNEDDFKEMGNTILDNLKKENLFPLCIGLYNKTNGLITGFFDDLGRLLKEWELNAHSVIIFRQLVITLAKILPRQVLWTHIAHSEGGLIAREVLTNSAYCLSKQNSSMRDISGNYISAYCDIKGFCQRQLITVLYGAVGPVPNVVLHAINNYSKYDVAMRFASKYLDKFPKPRICEDEKLKDIAKDMVNYPFFPKSKSAECVFQELKASFIDKYPHSSTKNGFTVTILENIGEKFPLGVGDHAFQGETYQHALIEDIGWLEGEYGVSKYR